MDSGDKFIFQFKRWMDSGDHNEDNTSGVHKNMIGTYVESKIGFKKLIDVIETEEDDNSCLAREFKKDGGIITEVDGNIVSIEVESGIFRIERTHVRRKD